MGGASRWSVGRVVVFAWGTLGVVGCGSAATDSSPNPGASAGLGGASGSAAAGDASTSAGTSGAHAGGASALGGVGGAPSASAGTAGLSLGDSPAEACIAYTVAQCLRRAECAGYTSTLDNCLQQSLGCPDTLFSDGSTRTVAGLKACATAFATFSCEQLNLGFLPDCVTPGMRTPGQACAFNAQCASLSCNSNSTDCGQCDALGGVGDDCSAAGVDCSAGLSCTAGQCVTAVDPNRFTEGSACSAAFGCNTGLYCERSGTSGVCTKDPTLGMPCDEFSECGDGSFCSMEQPPACTAPPGAGQPCGIDQSGAAHCSADSACSFTDATHVMCLALPGVGKPCLKVLDQDLSVKEEDCAEGSFCDATSTCVAPGAPGASCQGNGQCQAGLSCNCADGTRTSCAGASGSSGLTCSTLGFTNDSCGILGALCHPGFTCTGGSCQPRASQGLFGARCTNN